ncbi:MAG: tetratricopeptide repeat protein [Planctomycetaceae bacterium]
MRRIIKEEEPPKPSAKVSTLGQQLETVTNRQPATKRQLHEVLRGELDWIAIKALEKNRGRRYQTADALEEDVRCFLADEPVQACPPSRIYRFKKLVRRNKTTVVGLMLFATMLLAGTVVSAAFAVRAREAERKANRASNVARQEAKEATAISQFLENDLLRGGLTAINNPGISLREALDRAATAVDVRTYDDPLVEAKVHLIVGLAYHSINQQSAAKYHLQRACDVRTRHLGETHRDTMQAAFHLTVAKAAYDRAATSTDVERAEAVVGQFEQLLKTQEAVLGSSDPDALSTMGYLATCYGRLGRYEEAEFLFEKANRGFESAVPPRDPRARRCLKQSIGCLRAIGKAEAANELESRYKGQIHAVDVAQYEKAATRVAEVRQLVKQCQNDYGANAPETVKALEQLGDALVESNAGLDAEPVFQTVLAAQVESFGASHAETFRIKRKLGQLYVRLYQLQKGADYLAQTLSDPKVDGTTLQSLRVIANLMKLKQQFAEAADIHGLLAQTQTRLFGETDARTIGSIHDQGLTYAVMEDISGLQGVIEELKTRVGHDKSSTISCESHLGKLYLKSGDAEKAAQFLTELFDRSQRSLGEDKSLTLATGHVLAESLYQLGQKAEAIDLAKDCLAKCESQLGERDLQTMLTLMLLGEWLMDSEQEASLGSEYLERAIDIEPSLVGLRRQRLGWLKRIAEHAEKASASGNPVDTEQHTQLLKRLAELAERWKDAETTEYATTRLKQLSKRD